MGTAQYSAASRPTLIGASLFGTMVTVRKLRWRTNERQRTRRRVVAGIGRQVVSARAAPRLPGRCNAADRGRGPGGDVGDARGSAAGTAHRTAWCGAAGRTGGTAPGGNTRRI